jgi:hypothetical protein
MRDDLPKMQFEAAWCLTNIASGNSDHVKVLVENKLIENFNRLLMSPHIEIIEQVIWGLGNIAGDNVEMRNRVIE